MPNLTPSQELGQLGESKVLSSYLKDGFKLVEANWRCVFGEIDLIIQKKQLLVFAEVKTGKKDAAVHPLENITLKKAHKLQLLIQYYIEIEKLDSMKINEVRLDIATVLEDSGKFKIDVIENLPMPWA